MADGGVAQGVRRCGLPPQSQRGSSVRACMEASKGLGQMETLPRRVTTIRAGYMMRLQERRAAKNMVAAAWVGKETYLNCILYGAKYRTV